MQVWQFQMFLTSSNNEKLNDYDRFINEQNIKIIIISSAIHNLEKVIILTYKHSVSELDTFLKTED